MAVVGGRDGILLWKTFSKELNTHTLPLHKTIGMPSQLVRIAKHTTVHSRAGVALGSALGRLRSSKVGGDATNVH